MHKPIVADDLDVFRIGTMAILEQRGEYDVVAECSEERVLASALASHPRRS